MMRDRVVLPEEQEDLPPELQELARALYHHQQKEALGDRGATVSELAKTTGLDERKIREYLRDFQEMGRLKVGRAKRLNLAGIMHRRPVYALAKKEEDDEHEFA